MIDENPQGARASRRQWIGLGVIALPCMLYSMDLTVLDLAVPQISAALKPTSAQLLWIVDIYGFVLAGLLIPMGALGDRLGRRKLLLMGAAAFSLASLLAAFSTSAEMLIAARALLGVAGATLAPSTLSLIRNMFTDPRERATAISVWVMSYSVGGAIGPLAGGFVLSHFWWGAAFLIGLPVMLLLLIAGPLLLPEFRDPQARSIDMPSVGMSLAAVLMIIYGVKQLAQGAPALMPSWIIVVGIVTAIAFARRQQRLANPLLDLQLLAIPSFAVALGAYALATFVSFGIFFYIAQYLQLVQGLSPLAAGIAMIPLFLGFIVGSLIAPWLVRRVPPSTVMTAGLAIASVGFLLLAAAVHTGNMMLFEIGCVGYCLALSPVTAIATDVMMGAAPVERAGSAAALSETGSELGGALGVAVLGSVGNAVFRWAMDGRGHAGYVRDLLLPSGRADLAGIALGAFGQSVEAAAVVAALLGLSASVLIATVQSKQTAANMSMQIVN